jgi:hypothetical protein
MTLGITQSYRISYDCERFSCHFTGFPAALQTRGEDAALASINLLSPATCRQ